jgi:hypothetical protein
MGIESVNSWSYITRSFMLCTSHPPNITWVIKKERWEGHVACMGRD